MGVALLAPSSSHLLAPPLPTQPACSNVLSLVRLTSQGSTLFGGAEIIKRQASGRIKVVGYVTHYVAKYDRDTVSKFVAKMYGKDTPLDDFYCSDSIPNVIAWLKVRRVGLEPCTLEPSSTVHATLRARLQLKLVWFWLTEFESHP